MCGKFNRRDAFAAILETGRVVAWGDPASSGDGSRVEDQLTNVHHIQSTKSVFAAIHGDGELLPGAGQHMAETAVLFKNF